MQRLLRMRGAWRETWGPGVKKGSGSGGVMGLIVNCRKVRA